MRHVWQRMPGSWCRVGTENHENDLATTHKSVAAIETKSSSGAELLFRLITGRVWLGMKPAVLHFKKKDLVNIPEVLNLCNIHRYCSGKKSGHSQMSSSQDGQWRLLYRGQGRCNKFGERGMIWKRIIAYTRMATWSPPEDEEWNLRLQMMRLPECEGKFDRSLYSYRSMLGE
jgi:hypothetical protein